MTYEEIHFEPDWVIRPDTPVRDCTRGHKFEQVTVYTTTQFEAVKVVNGQRCCCGLIRVPKGTCLSATVRNEPAAVLPFAKTA